MSLLKRLNNDEALAPFVAQFVPIKIDTGSKEYSVWSRLHKKEGRGIPIVYIVRADGQTMYAKSGGLKTPQLAELLGTCLDNCGRIFSKREVDLMLNVDQSVTRLREAGETVKAIRKLSEIKRLGLTANMQTFAKPVTSLVKHVTELTEQGQKDLAKVQELLADDASEQKQIDALTAIAEAKSTYSKLPTLKSEFTKINRQLTRDKDLRALSKDLKTIKRYQSAKSKSAIERGITALNKIVESRKEGVVADRARELLEKLGGNIENSPTQR